MTFSDDRLPEVSKKKTVIRFLAGIGVGVVFGWLGALFRKSPMQAEQTANARGGADVKAEEPLPPTEPALTESDGEPVLDSPLKEAEAAVDDVSEIRVVSPGAVTVDNNWEAEGEASQESLAPQEDITALQGAAGPAIEGAFGPPRIANLEPEGEEASNDAFGVQPPPVEVTSSNVRSQVQCDPEHGPDAKEVASQRPELSGAMHIGVPAASSSAVSPAIEEELVGGPREARWADDSTVIEESEGQGLPDFVEGEAISPQTVGSASARSTEKRSAAPTTYRPRPPEPSDEYASSFADHLPTEYLRWNRWVVEHIVGSARKNAEVYLSITPAILARIVEELGEASTSPGDAEAAFTEAVAAAYAAISIQNGRLRLLRRYDSNGSPICAAFLAASVLAAYRMQSDEDAYGGAYYFRLAKLLTCEMAAGHPQGFDPAVFESLWIFLKTWLTDKTGACLATPGPDAGMRRFVALPLMHVPLRRLDIEKLPSFFAWAGYAAGSKLPDNRLLYDLDSWSRSYASLSSAGIAALGDERRHAVVSQVTQELAAWDGSTIESSGRRSASVELMLDIVSYRPHLFYLPRRPDGFPPRFNDGVHLLEAADEGWYDQLPVSADDGSELANGFEWRSIEGSSVGFRRSAAVVVPLAPHPEYSYFISRSNLLRGTRCAVLCQDRVANTTADYLSASAGRICTPISHPNIPSGWKLFTNVLPEREIEIPDGLDALDLDTQVNIICSGGLRLGRRREWLAGAPPKKIVITGLEKSDIVRMDGQEVSLSEDGVIQTNGHLFEPGLHTIEAAGHRTTFEIVEPEISAAITPTRLDSARLVTLPSGRWTLIGSVPGEISGPIVAGRLGAICKPDFDPAWAISVGAGPGAIVASIEPEPPLPYQLRSFKPKRASQVQYWATLIYDAAVRRPEFSSLRSTSNDEQIRTIWPEYVGVAKKIKRQWRKAR